MKISKTCQGIMKSMKMRIFACALIALTLAGCGEETTRELFDRCMDHGCSAKDMATLNQATGEN
jgi:hypothetical protein